MSHGVEDDNFKQTDKGELLTLTYDQILGRSTQMY
jgi:hypothetical protein